MEGNYKAISYIVTNSNSEEQSIFDVSKYGDLEARNLAIELINKWLIESQQLPKIEGISLTFSYGIESDNEQTFFVSILNGEGTTRGDIIHGLWDEAIAYNLIGIHFESIELDFEGIKQEIIAQKHSVLLNFTTK